MPRRRPGAEPKKRGRPAKAVPAKKNRGGRPKKFPGGAEPKRDDGVITSNPITPSKFEGGGAYEVASGRIAKVERQVGLGGPRDVADTRDMAPSEFIVGPGVPQFEVARNPSKPTPGSGATEFVREPRLSPQVEIAPGVPHPSGPQVNWERFERPVSGTEHNVIPRSRVDPMQRRLGDAKIFERGVALHQSLRHLMEGTRSVQHKPSSSSWLTTEDIAKEKQYQKAMKARTGQVESRIDLGVMRPQVAGEDPRKTPVNPHDVPVWNEFLTARIPRKQQVNPSKNTMRKFEDVKSAFNSYRSAFRKPGGRGEYEDADNGLPTDFGDWGHW